MEKELEEKGWIKEFNCDESGYWFNKKFYIPIFGEMEATINIDEDNIESISFTIEDSDKMWIDKTFNVTTIEGIEKIIEDNNLKSRDNEKND